MIAQVDPIQERVAFQSGDWRLQGKLAYPEIGKARGALVIAGPHPHLGGDMDNNVVSCLADHAARSGLVSLRFDYQGVGQSEGPQRDVAKMFAEFLATSHVAGEAELWRDVAAAAAFLRQYFPDIPLALAGYSFGCSLLPWAAKSVRAHPSESIPHILVAPTVSRHEFGVYRQVTDPLLVIASEDDFATSSQDLDAWFSGLATSRELVRKPCDNHFFRGHEKWVSENSIRFLDKCWAVENRHG